MSTDLDIPELIMATLTTSAQLGAAMRAERHRAGLTQVALAERAGVSRAWLARFEAGHPSASLEQVLLVLRALGLGLELAEPQLRPKDQALLEQVRGRREIPR